MGLLPRRADVTAYYNRVLQEPRTAHSHYNLWASRVNTRLHTLCLQDANGNDPVFNQHRISFVDQPRELFLGPRRTTFPDAGQVFGQDAVSRDGVHLTDAGSRRLYEHMIPHVVAAYRRSLQ